jgi:hypothetical protein
VQIGVSGHQFAFASPQSTGCSDLNVELARYTLSVILAYFQSTPPYYSHRECSERECSSALVDISSPSRRHNQLGDSLALAALITLITLLSLLSPLLSSLIILIIIMSSRSQQLLSLSAPGAAVAHAHSGCSPRVYSTRIPSMQPSVEDSSRAGGHHRSYASQQLNSAARRRAHLPSASAPPLDSSSHAHRHDSEIAQTRNPSNPLSMLLCNQPRRFHCCLLSYPAPSTPHLRGLAQC